ncbi:hypothetical protein [Oceanithermus sp.]
MKEKTIIGQSKFKRLLGLIALLFAFFLFLALVHNPKTHRQAARGPAGQAVYAWMLPTETAPS